MGFSRHIFTWSAAGLAGLLLLGCSSDARPHDVPSTAVRKVEGNRRLVYTAPDQGTVWVTEGASNIIYSTPVRAGDRVVVDPDVGKVMLDEQVVLDKDVNHNDHKIFFLAGASPTPVAMAASERRVNPVEGVPPTALIGGEGKDRVEYTAPLDGFVWVTDEDQHRVLYAAPVGRGDLVVVDPQKNQLTVNGQPVYRQNISNNDHRIFFSSERPAGWRTAEPMVSSEVPADAIERVEGTGRIDFVADRDGMVWVTDVTRGRTIYAAHVLRNDHVTIDPGANLLALNGQPVYTHDLPHDRYRVYFSER